MRRTPLFGYRCAQRLHHALDGQGGTAGSRRGESRVTLEDIDAGTRLHYTAKGAQIGGKLAQVGRG